MYPIIALKNYLAYFKIESQIRNKTLQEQAEAIQIEKQRVKEASQRKKEESQKQAEALQSKKVELQKKEAAALQSKKIQLQIRAELQKREQYGGRSKYIKYETIVNFEDHLHLADEFDFYLCLLLINPKIAKSRFTPAQQLTIVKKICEVHAKKTIYDGSSPILPFSPLLLDISAAAHLELAQTYFFYYCYLLPTSKKLAKKLFTAEQRSLIINNFCEAIKIYSYYKYYGSPFKLGIPPHDLLKLANEHKVFYSFLFPPSAKMAKRWFTYEQRKTILTEILELDKQDIVAGGWDRQNSPFSFALTAQEHLEMIPYNNDYAVFLLDHRTTKFNMEFSEQERIAILTAACKADLTRPLNLDHSPLKLEIPNAVHLQLANEYEYYAYELIRWPADLKEKFPKEQQIYLLNRALENDAKSTDSHIKGFDPYKDILSLDISAQEHLNLAAKYDNYALALSKRKCRDLTSKFNYAQILSILDMVCSIYQRIDYSYFSTPIALLLSAEDHLRYADKYSTYAYNLINTFTQSATFRKLFAKHHLSFLTKALEKIDNTRRLHSTVVSRLDISYAEHLKLAERFPSHAEYLIYFYNHNDQKITSAEKLQVLEKILTAKRQTGSNVFFPEEMQTLLKGLAEYIVTLDSGSRSKLAALCRETNVFNGDLEIFRIFRLPTMDELIFYSWYYRERTWTPVEFYSFPQNERISFMITVMAIYTDKSDLNRTRSAVSEAEAKQYEGVQGNTILKFYFPSLADKNASNDIYLNCQILTDRIKQLSSILNEDPAHPMGALIKDKLNIDDSLDEDSFIKVAAIFDWAYYTCLQLHQLWSKGLKFTFDTNLFAELLRYPDPETRIALTKNYFTMVESAYFSKNFEQLKIVKRPPCTKIATMLFAFKCFSYL